MCTTGVNKLVQTEWKMNSFGYLLVSQTIVTTRLDVMGQKHPSTWGLAPFNSAAAIFCKPEVLRSVEQRAVEFSYKYKDDWNLSFFKAEWNFALRTRRRRCSSRSSMMQLRASSWIGISLATTLPRGHCTLTLSWTHSRCFNGWWCYSLRSIGGENPEMCDLVCAVQSRDPE